MEVGILVDWQLTVGDHGQKSLVDQLIIVWHFNRHVPHGLGPKGEILLHPTQGAPRNSTGSEILDPLGSSNQLSLFHLLYYLI